MSIIKEKQKEFRIVLSNIFSALENLQEENAADDEDNYSTFKDIILKTASTRTRVGQCVKMCRNVSDLDID